MDNNNVESKLENLYEEICENTFVLSRNDAINLLKTYKFDKKDDIELTPMGLNIFDEYDDKPSELLNEDSIGYSKDIVEKLEDYEEEEMFMVENIKEEIADEILQKKFKNACFSDYFTNNERTEVFKILINATVKYVDNDKLNLDNNIKSFIKQCSINDFINSYLTNDEFSKTIFKIYEQMYDDKVFSPNLKDKNENIKTINDLIREKFIKIYNKNISIGMTNNDSILVLLGYLNGKYYNTYMNNMYKEELGGFNIEEICDKKYTKIIIITDYLRMMDIKQKESFNLDEIDNEYINFISENDVDEIITRFNYDEDFAFYIIGEFIELNAYCSLSTRKSYKNNNLIKKLNPLYQFDFKIEKDC